MIDLIVDHTLKPLVEGRLKKFESRARELAKDKRPKEERRAELQKLDPAQAVLDLKVLDPAMGSGHFLVTAVDFLSDYISELIEYVPAVPEWLDDDDAYASPLLERVENIRKEITARARKKGWRLFENQLTDQAIIRRMVLKRCIYGVDKNYLTVELAKVSLWLHSFTVGVPLTFLDHHLRCGDSLVGMRVADMLGELQRLGGVYASSAVQSAQTATDAMMQIEAISDSDISEVQESEMLFEGVENATANLRSVLNFICSVQWMTAGMKAREKTAFEEPIQQTLIDFSEDSYKLLARGYHHFNLDSGGETPERWMEFRELWKDAHAIADHEGFLHWEVAFPGVWKHWQDINPKGGFDAVIGNPPWERIKLQEIEWFAERAKEISLQPNAAARRRAIRDLQNRDTNLADEFERAKNHADQLGQVIRSSGDYPLLGRGDINLYSTFVERGKTLVKSDGFVGLLTPSGIYGDQTAAAFFKQVSTGGQLYGLYDFENRRPETGKPHFFPDVDSRFKFCALIFGGSDRLLGETKCAFFLHDIEDINNPERCFSLTPADFARVNPNTGTAPVFRTRRDADITRRIYEDYPVLVDRSGKKEKRVWPVRYRTMFHMANNSNLFLTIEELKDGGMYPVGINRWQRGNEVYVPLYEGKMVQAFDHRAASVINREGNLFRPGQTDKTLADEYLDASFAPRPRYWVDSKEIESDYEEDWLLAFKDITASTNVRTMIASIIPKVGSGHTLPILGSLDEPFDALSASCILANLNSFCFDYVARQKVQATHLTWYAVEQLPVVAPEDYDRQFGKKTVREIVTNHVLRLTYTSHDMEPFARDLGYNGTPFMWDTEERRHLRARLDALYFHLYGISNDDAEYILSTFPIVRREDEREFGRYRTSEMIISYMNALAAGDTEVVVSV